MKLVVIAFLALVQCCLAGELRDGSWWAQLNAAQKETWTVGWMDGTATGQRISGDDAAYRTSVSKFKGMDSTQIAQGLDQFYASDYRNLTIGLADAALLVAMYARGLDDKAAVAMAATLREKYRTAAAGH